MDEIPESYSERLKAYHEALKTEWEVASNKEILDVDEARSVIRKMFLGHIPAIVTNMCDLALNADSESVQFNAGKYALSEFGGNGSLDDPNAEFAKIMNELRVRKPE